MDTTNKEEDTHDVTVATDPTSDQEKAVEVKKKNDGSSIPGPS